MRSNAADPTVAEAKEAIFLAVVELSKNAPAKERLYVHRL